MKCKLLYFQEKRIEFEFEFYDPVNTLYVMSSRSVNLLTLSPGQA